VINYADDAYDDDDFDDSEGGARRPTGLRSLRREDLEKKDTAADKLGKEIHEPIDVQGIYREWMIRRTVKPTYENPEYAPCAAFCGTSNLRVP
jgi:chromatin structure-remodeling complex subunit SFH1